MTDRKIIESELSSLLSLENWKALARAVCRYDAEIVVLVARKMPRLMEILDLSFPRGSTVLTDLAIPFSHQLFKDKRVAIVDDIINVGTTMGNAQQQAEACGAAQCKLFALGARKHSNRIPLSELLLVEQDPMEESEYAEFVRHVPAALQLISKPYDMDFPVVECFLRPPFRDRDNIWAWFSGRFGDRAHLLTSGLEERIGLVRISVDFPAGPGANLKARLYFDTSAGTCNVIPMAVPPRFSFNPAYAENSWPGTVWNILSNLASGTPAGAALWVEEPLARAELFVHSLAFVSEVLRETSEILAVQDPLPFSLEDASLAFGPGFARAIADAHELDTHTKTDLDERIFRSSKPAAEGEPLRSNMPKEHLEKIESQSKKLAECGDWSGAFCALFESLSDAVGAANVSSYKLNWPFNADIVKDKPYLRLRVGYSFKDLVSFFQTTCSRFIESALPIRSIVSILLDQFIDSGALVPAIANYNGSYYRVYRKGENEFWEKEVNRVLYAWQCCERPLSLTRFAKLQAILAFSAEASTSVVPDVMERGNVGYLPPSVVDRSGAEIGRLLLRTGKLKVAKDESA